MNKNDLMQCLWCGNQVQIIWVHGHGQCPVCGTNIEECCRGENISCEKSTTKDDPNDNSRKSSTQ